MSLNRDTFNTIITVLLPNMSNQGERRALVENALFGCTVLNQIEWNGAAHAFTVSLVRKLLDFGECEASKPAIVQLLEELHTQVGTTRQKEIDRIIGALQTHSTPTKPTGEKKTMNETAAIGFLIEIGRWAKSELSERWTLRRQSQEADLSERNEVEETVPEMIETTVNARSEKEVQRTFDLIERKRDAIFRARSAKLADREEFDAQRLAKSAFEIRAAEHNKTIKQMMDDIEIDLNDLGFDVARTPD